MVTFKYLPLFLLPMAVKKESAPNFVSTMLQSAQDATPVKAQTRFDQVDEAQLQKTMDSLKKGVLRR